MFDCYCKVLHLNTTETVIADDPLFNHMLLHYSLPSAKCELSYIITRLFSYSKLLHFLTGLGRLDWTSVRLLKLSAELKH